MRFYDVPLKWKLTLTIMLVSFFAVVASGLLLFIHEHYTVATMAERDLESLTRITASNSTAALVFDDANAARATLEGLAAKPSIELACLYGRDGRLFSLYSRDEKNPQAPERAGVDGFDRSGSKLALFNAVLLKNKRIGTIYIRSDLKQIADWNKTYALVSTMIVFAMVLFAFFLTTLLQRPFLAPIVELSTAARQVSAKKDYSVRVKKFGDDELGRLTDCFNEMLCQIHARDEDLENARAGLEQRVEARTLELQKLNKELEAFSYSVAHDLRAPLRGIDGFSQALLEDYGPSLDDAGKNYLLRVRSATQRMAQLLDDLLNLSRVTRTNIHPGAVNLSEIAASIVRDLRSADPSREIEFRLAPDLKAYGDPGLLRIALENLLGNAWKFSGKQANPVVEFGKTTIDGIEAFFVRDNGAGFDMQFAGKLFTVFHRLHTGAEFPGTGVGLATVQRIVGRHGGRIWAHAELGKGATFYFTIQAQMKEAEL